jgi:ribonuclease HI
MNRYEFLEPKKERELTKVGYIYVDGSTSHANPGPGGFGLSCANNLGDEKVGISCFVADTATNNQMEYLGMLMAVKFLKSKKFSETFDSAIICSDSKILITTLKNQSYDPSGKNPVLTILRDKILKAMAESPVPVELKWIPREMNERADELSKIGSSGNSSVFGMDLDAEKFEEAAFTPLIEALKEAREMEGEEELGVGWV